MGLITRVVRWYKLTYGVGDTMLSAGAELLPCPHCGAETPVYHTTYDATGDPVSFSVCLWCEGLIEYSTAVGHPHHPYATAQELRAEPSHSHSAPSRGGSPR